jgi:peptidyl-prolyl cis-trans isomerase SurA
MYQLKFLISFSFKIIFLFYILFNGNLYPNLNNKILIKVEDRVITNFDIKNKIISSLILSGQEINQTNINKLKEQTIIHLIQLRLKEMEILKHNLKTDKLKLNSYLLSISKGNIKNLENSFKNNGGDYEIFKEEIVTELKWQKLIYLLYSKKIQIDQNLVESELKNLIEKQENIEEFKISEIEIVSNEKFLFDLIEQINEIGFRASAIKFSIAPSSTNGGEIGWVNGKSMNKEIYNIVSKMKIGNVSKPIRKQESFIILKLLDKKNTKIKTENISRLKKQIVDQQKNDLFNLFSRSHLSKIKNLSMIEYK